MPIKLRQLMKLTFPFLVLRHRGDFRPITNGERIVHGLPFSSADQATLFMEGKGETNWEFALVASSGLPAIIKQLEEAALFGQCLDPQPDETGGTSISIQELRSLVPRGL
jgi:hypothetical protein